VSAVVASIQAMAHGQREEFDRYYLPTAVDRENDLQPPASRIDGPAGFYATAQWLRSAFADLRYEIHHAVQQGDLVTVNSTMRGQHVGPCAFYNPDGSLDAVFPPTHQHFAMTQSHWFRVENDRIAEHWANRDDLGTARQLGWIPPTPLYLLRMSRAKRKLRKNPVALANGFFSPSP
jgi:predicted ester cyclase